MASVKSNVLLATFERCRIFTCDARDSGKDLACAHMPRRARKGNTHANGVLQRLNRCQTIDWVHKALSVHHFSCGKTADLGLLLSSNFRGIASHLETVSGVLFLPIHAMLKFALGTLMNIGLFRDVTALPC